MIDLLEDCDPNAIVVDADGQEIRVVENLDDEVEIYA